VRKLLRLFLAFLALVAMGNMCPPKAPKIVPIRPEPGSTVHAGPVEIVVVVTDDYEVKSVLYHFPGADPVPAHCCPPDTYWLFWDASTVEQNQWDTIRVRAEDHDEMVTWADLSYFVVAK